MNRRPLAAPPSTTPRVKPLAAAQQSPEERRLRQQLRHLASSCDRHARDCRYSMPGAAERLDRANTSYIRVAERLELTSAGRYRIADDPRLATLDAVGPRERKANAS